MSKRVCELCSNPARMFCDSDQASLCWDCDEKVHAANFLVAKHCRTLLCHVCSSPTPWKAAGPKLGATLSVCHACARRGGADDESAAAHQSENVDTDADREYYTTESDDFSEEDEDEEDEDEEGENQVVPWSASASSSEEENLSFSSSKRMRDSSEDEDGCCSSGEGEMSNEDSDENYCSSPSRFLRPLKMGRGSGGGALKPPALGTAAIVEKLRRFESDDASEMIMGLCELTRD